jgi:hypothetical protein
MAGSGGGSSGISQQLRAQAIIAARLNWSTIEDGGHEGIELTSVGLGITIKEEGQGGVAPVAGGARVFDRGRSLIAGCKHAEAAVHLDPLVVAIGGAP